MGTSMGCMHGFVWGETYPDFARALMPLACEPVEIAGLNRMWRQMAIDGDQGRSGVERRQLRHEPMTGPAHRAEPAVRRGSRRRFTDQAQYPTRDAADAICARTRSRAAIDALDANDLIYQLDASRNYNPWPGLERIKAPLTWINSADDFINPRNLDFPGGAQANADGALPPDPGKRRHPRPWHAHLGEVLEGGPYLAAGAVGRS